VTPTRVGTLSFLGLSSLSARLRWNMFSLWYVFALRVKCYLYVNAKENLAENAASPFTVG